MQPCRLSVYHKYPVAGVELKPGQAAKAKCAAEKNKKIFELFRANTVISISSC